MECILQSREYELIEAARIGDFQMVHNILGCMVNVNHYDDNRNTAIIYASCNDHLGIVKDLLKQKDIDVNFQEIEGWTSLMYASLNGNIHIVRELLKHKDINLNLQNTNGETALILASNNGELDIVRALLGCKTIDVNHEDEFGNTALIVACNNGDLEIVQAMLNCATIDVNHENILGMTALRYAKEKGYSEVLECLESYKKVKNSRKKLLKAMKDPTSEPLELDMEYVKHSMTNDILGEGSFGVVYLAHDSQLPKKFVVKQVNFSRADEGAIRDIYKSFQTEILVRNALR
jgi:ankyrin repeat protein